MTQENRENFFTELLKFALVAIVIVIPVRLYVAQPFIVSGASMEPTFDNGEYLIVDEISYRLTGPERGDIIIFHPPGKSSEYYIKRIVGLPNETIYVTDSSVSVKKTTGTIAELDESYVTNKGNGRTMSVVLQDGEYFVMGDNRPASSDSRSWGILPEKNIVGRALVRLLPLQNAALFPGSTSQN